MAGQYTNKPREILAQVLAQTCKRRGRVKRGRNRVGQLFCMMASSLARSKLVARGAFHRRLAARSGGLVAMKALARKLATWFWRVMVKVDDYVENGVAHYGEQVRQGKERALRRLAKELGQKLTRIDVWRGLPLALRLSKGRLCRSNCGETI